MSAEVGETVILGIRRVDPVCTSGLTISGRQAKLELLVVQEIPSLSVGGLAALGSLLSTVGLLLLRRRGARPPAG